MIGLVVGVLSTPKTITKRKNKKKNTPFPECKRGCDVNQCNTWCMAKERFKNNPPQE